ncbi:MAG: phosphate ABC transporter permease PstA [Opitutales bacterium]
MTRLSEIHHDKARPKGESLVWFTGLGLGIGILLVIGLLAVIVKNGLTVFWPKTMYAVELVEGSTAGPANGEDFLGAVTLEREKRIQEEDSLERSREYQFFTGNRNVYGEMYHFLDEDQIKRAEDGGPKFTKAEDVIVIERMEYGDAIGHPVSLEKADGPSIGTNDPGFRRKLFNFIESARESQADYKRIKENELSRINRELEELRGELRAQVDKPGAIEQETVNPGAAHLKAEIDALEEEYGKLRAQAKALQEEQKKNRLILGLANGEKLEVPFNNIKRAHFPNSMGYSDKLGHFFRHIWHFVSERPREANTQGGIFPAIFGTFIMTVLMSAAVMPFGVIAAIYLREYASQGFFVRGVRIAVNNLAGVPSIVYGVFGLGFFVYILGGNIDKLFFAEKLPTATFGTGGILWASLTLALLTVPVVIVATEEALSSVPRGTREASLACGASKWQTIQRIVLPASAPGILTGLILAMARGAGEVAPLMLVGVVKLAPSLPLDGEFPYIHLERKFMHLGFHIYDLGFQSPDSDAAKPMVFATTLLLITLVVLLNLGAIVLREYLRKKYRADTF